MPAKFPNEEFVPRVKENRTGVVYDETKTKTIYAEDFQDLENEVVEIEDRLRPDTDNPLPYGFSVGDSESKIKLTKYTVGGVDFPCLESTLIAPDFGAVMTVFNSLINILSESKLGGLFFYNPDTQETNALYYEGNVNYFYCTSSFAVIGVLEDRVFEFGIIDDDGNLIWAGVIMSDYLNNRLKIQNNLYITGALEVSGNIKSSSLIESSNGFKSGANLGVTSTYTIVGDVRMSGGVLQKKTRTITVNGGITTAVGALSDWINA